MTKDTPTVTIEFPEDEARATLEALRAVVADKPLSGADVSLADLLKATKRLMDAWQLRGTAN